MQFTLGEDCELSIGIQDFGETLREDMSWQRYELYRRTDFKPFIGIKPTRYGAFVDEIVLTMTMEQAIKLKQALDKVWSEDALEWHDKQSGGGDNAYPNN